MLTTVTVIADSEETYEDDLLDKLACLNKASYNLFTQLKRRMDKNNVAQRPTFNDRSKTDYNKRLINILRKKELIRFCPYTTPFTGDRYLIYPKYSVMLNPFLLVPADKERVQDLWDLLSTIRG